jgi:hypothetical protein
MVALVALTLPTVALGEECVSSPLVGSPGKKEADIKSFVIHTLASPDGNVEGIHITIYKKGDSGSSVVSVKLIQPKATLQGDLALILLDEQGNRKSQYGFLHISGSNSIGSALFEKDRLAPGALDATEAFICWFPTLVNRP